MGSTNLTQHLDPEDGMSILDGALKRLAKPVELHGGRVTRFMDARGHMKVLEERLEAK